jgi:hypothetical protein
VGAGEAGGDAYPPLVAIGRPAADILVLRGCSRLLHIPCFLMEAAVRRKAELLYRGGNSSMEQEARLGRR